jgi:hypothetical protein
MSDAVARGAAIAPAGLTAHSPGREAATIAAIRDSALKHLGPSIAERARTTPPSAETQDRLGATQAAVRQTAERTTSAGNSRDIHVPMGQGVGGVGAGGGGGGFSVAAPFLSGGKSRATGAQRGRRRRQPSDHVETRGAARGQARFDSARFTASGLVAQAGAGAQARGDARHVAPRAPPLTTRVADGGPCFMAALSFTGSNDRSRMG